VVVAQNNIPWPLADGLRKVLQLVDAQKVDGQPGSGQVVKHALVIAG
jgi:hypothetical protein